MNMKATLAHLIMPKNLIPNLFWNLKIISTKNYPIQKTKILPCFAQEEYGVKKHLII